MGANAGTCKVCGAIPPEHGQPFEDDVCDNCRRSLCETLVELPHEFVTEVNCLVTENHTLALRGIQQREDGLVEHFEEALAGEDQEIIQSEIRHAREFHEDLRRVANHSTLVTLVTRLDHWTRKFVKQLTLSPEKGLPVVREMEALNKFVGAAPIPVKFFEDLVTARDSVIHGNSQTEWEYQGKIRRVADKYVNAYEELAFTEEHLSEAVANATTQVKWYAERLATS